MATKIPSNQARFSAAELLDIFKGVSLPAGFEGVRGVATDSRCELNGSLFVALAGERFDGHDYVARAVAQGAKAVLVDERRLDALSVPQGIAILPVRDTLTALGDLALHHRRRFRGKLVAIGGSAGKTTTRSVTRAILERIRPDRVHATHGNLNNRIGVPMTLLTLADHHELSVIEVGTNQIGEVAELARIAEPDVGLLTLIDLEHTSGLSDLAGVEREECALFDAVSMRSGTLVGNADDERVRAALARYPKSLAVGYGEYAGATVQILERVVESDLRMRIRLRSGAREITVRTHLLGRPGALAVAAGVAVAQATLGVLPDDESIENAIREAGEPGRSSLVSHESGALILDDSYNANPASMAAGIESARELADAAGAELVLVLGEMRELGDHSQVEHERLGSRASEASPSRLIFVGGDAALAARAARERGQTAEFAESAKEARELLATSLKPRNLILLKGSRGVSLERII